MDSGQSNEQMVRFNEELGQISRLSSYVSRGSIKRRHVAISEYLFFRRRPVNC
jgi:hypothetical protein